VERTEAPASIRAALILSRLLVAVTEKRTTAEIDSLVEVLAA